MKKRIVSLLLAVLMVTGTFPVQVFAADENISVELESSEPTPCDICGNEVCTCESTGEEGEQTEEPVEEEKYAKLASSSGVIVVAEGTDLLDDAIGFYYDEFEENTIFLIKDSYVADNEGIWYKVEVYSGGVKESVLEEFELAWPEEAWILYDYTDESYDFEATLVFVERCEICGEPGCETEHVKCEVCGEYDCDLVHFYCDICEKHDCGVTHPYCVVCEKVDCGVKHTYCGHCGAIDCEIEHEDLYTPETAPIIPENPTLPEGEAVSVVDEFGYSVSEGVYLAEGEKASFSAWADDASSYQWQVCYNNASDLWIDIYGANEKGILVSPAMFFNIINYQGETYLRCVVTTGEETVIGEAIPVTVLEAVPVEEAPMMYAARDISEGSSDQNNGIATAAEEGNAITHAINIFYRYDPAEGGENGGKEIASSYTANLPAGGNYTLDVPFPDVPGYRPGKVDGAAIAEGVDRITRTIVNIQAPIVIFVDYVPDYVDFKVEHYWQNIADDNYTLHETSTVTGLKTGEPVSNLEKSKIVKNYTGFSDLIYDSTITVAADGSTVVKVYYDRNYAMIRLDLAGGHGAEPIYARYGTPVVIANPERAGHTFAGWNPALPSTVPERDTDYTAKWTVANANFTVAFYYENANDKDYTYVGSIQKTGTTGETINGATYKDEQYDGYKADYAKHFTYSHYQEGVTVKEDGTAVVNLYFSRNKYTLTYYEFVCQHIKNNEHNGDCCTLTVHTHTTACCNLQHIHNSTAGACCTLTVHTHGTDCTCNTQAHQHSRDCLSNFRNNPDTTVRNELEDKYPNPENGFYCNHKTIFGTNRYYVYLGGSWYRINNSTPSYDCGYSQHSHSASCCIISQHTHGSGCNTNKCGKTAHDHSSGRLSSCNISNCSVGYAHTHGNGCNTDRCAHLNASYFNCPCITSDSNNHIQENFANWRIVYQGNHKYEEDVGYIHQQMEGSEGYRWTDMYFGGELNTNEMYGAGGAMGAFTSMPGGTTTFCRAGNGSKPFRMTYWLETTDGSGSRTYQGRNFAKGNTFFNKMGHVAWNGDYVQATPEGFDTLDATFGTTDGTTGATDPFNNSLKKSQKSEVEYNNFYYIRETFDLEYFNGSTKVATRTMKYDEVLTASTYDIRVDNMVCPYGEGYEFGGWYLDPTCTVPVVWGSTRMPKGGMAVYAKWTPIIRSINVTIDTGNGAETTEIEVAHGSAVANPPKNPTKDGFNFVGWFYTDPVTGKENAFHFSMPVYRDMNLYAKWTSNSFATGTIYYKIEGTDTEVAHFSNINGTLGSTKTYSAKIGDELYEQYRTGYFPVVQSHNVKFDYADNNTYTFYYKEMDEVEYTVNFIDTATGEKVIDLDTGKPVDSITGTSKSSKITVDAINLRGYTIDAMSKEFVLSSDQALNVFNFYYTRDEENATVQIEHYIQNLAGNGYIHYFTEPTTKAKIGTVVTANAMTIDGFTYASNENNGKTLTDAGVVIKLYYTRNSYNYTFNFYINGTTEELADSVTGTAVYGKTVNQRAKNIPGYKLISATTMSITVGTTDASNVRNFYYEEEDVTIRYQVGAGGGGSVSSASETVKAVNGTAQGSTASVADANHTFVGWFDNYAGNGDALSTELGFVPKKVDNVYEAKTYYAKFAEVKVDINYVATTGGSVSSATEKVDVVTGIAVGSSATADENYKFVGWFDNAECTGDALSTTESFKPTRPDEGWGSGKTYYAKFAEKEATINYVAVGVGSVSPTTEPVDMVSGEAVGATATFDANIVEFRGWFDNANGEGTALSTAEYFKPTRPDDGWAETQTYYAVFDSIEYKITFVDRGTTISTETYKVGDTLTLPTGVNNGKYVVSWKVAETNGDWTVGEYVEDDVISNYGNVTIEAEWTINIYWVKEDIATNPGEDSIYGISENVLYGKEPTTFDIDKNTEGHQDPTKAPTAEYTYEFAGWADYTIPGEPLGAIAKRATFTEIPNVYTITFNTDGGSAVAPITKNYGEEVTAPANPTKEGYTFAGWDTEVPATMPAEDMIITAQWTVNQYTITFNTDGGTAVAPITQDYNTAVNKPADPIKEGYTFAGWSPAVPATMPAKDITVKAQWKINEYTVTFMDGFGNTISSEKMEYGARITYPGNQSKEGYTFIGWDKTVETVPANDVIVTAKWNVKQYTITFDTDGGTAIAPIKQNYGTTVAAPSNPTKEGYTFVKWDKTIPATMPAEDMIITAQWTVNQYTITFNTDGGTAIDAITQDYNTAVTAPADPTKEGYTFAGWDTEVPATMPAEDMTITAKWTVNQYTITFDTDGGSTVAPITQDYNTPVTAPANPTKTGYTFAGWDKTIPNTMPAEDMIITAQWTVNKYTITFDLNGGNIDGKTDDVIKNQDYNTAVTTPANPTKTGYTFAGWAPALPEKMPAENITVKAQWTVNKYTVTLVYDEEQVTVDNTGFTKDSDGWKKVFDYDSIINLDFDPILGYRITGVTINGALLVTAVNGIINNYTIQVDTKFEVTSEPIEYTITFDTDGGTAVAPITQDYNTAVTAPANPTKTGYTFQKWVRVDENGIEGEEYIIPATMPAENVYLKAKWTANTDTPYEVKHWQQNIDAEDEHNDTNFTLTDTDKLTGTTAEEVTPAVKSYTGFTAPAAQTVKIAADGKTVVNYYYTRNEYTITFNTNGGTTVAPITRDYGDEVTAPSNPTKEGYTFVKWDKTIPATMPAEDMTITAQWTVNQYTIKFDSDGGSAVAPITQDYNTAVTKPADPIKEGYTFAGWNTEVPATMPAKDMTITAQWTINQYTITFDTDGGNEIAPIKQNYNTAVTAPADPTKTGYTFAGWDVSVPATMPAEDMTITAQWTVNQYTITFDTVGGTAIDAITQNYNTAVTAPEDPTKEGYTFAGWDKDIPKNMPAGDMTITAKWTINQYTITFNTDGGNEIAPIKQNYGTAVTAPADPTKTGYTFAGWDKTIPNTMPAGDMTITAKWTINQYTITFDTDGGSDVAPITQDYNTAVTKPADPTKTGYTFKGWSPEVPATMPAENITVKAQWEINEYTITFDTDGGSDVDPITQNYGTTVTAPANPTKEGYTFTGWSPSVPTTMPAENITVKAQWEINQYTITWLNDDGTLIDTTTVDHGKVPTHADPNKAATAEFTYTFTGWTPTVVAATENAEYKATYSSATNVYTVTWKNEDGTVLETDENVPYGTTPSYNGATPTKAPTVEQTYEFDGWSPVVSAVTGDATYFASYTPHERTYEVIWKNYDGTVLETDEVAYNNMPEYNGEVPQKAGDEQYSYSFAGWSPTVAVVNGNAEYMATFTQSINQYTLSIEIDRGTGESKTVDYGSEVTVFATPETGYTVNSYQVDGGEVKEASSAGKWGFQVLKLVSNKHVKVTTRPIVYTITYNGLEGAVIGENPATYTIESDDIPLNKPTKVGYTFAGWTGTGLSEATKDVTISQGSTGNREYTANWTANDDTEYKVEHWQQNIDAEDEHNDTNFTLTDTDKLTGTTAEEVTPTVKSYTGFTAPAAQTVEITADGNTVVKYYYTRNKYTIKFVDGEDEDTVYLKKELAYGSGVTAPADPTKTGYTFAGWDKTIPNTMPAEDMIITAKWTINQYTITFNTDGGNEIAPIKQNYGTAVTAPEDPTKEGYTFAGWDKTIPNTMPAEDMIITAKWTINQYTITFDTDGGTEIAPIKQDYNTAVTAPADPTKTGYTFKGWSPDVPATMPAENITVKAQWERSLVDLTIITNSYNSEQSFIFTVTGTPSDESYGTVTLEVVLVGTDAITIKNLPVGIYTVTEKDGWSWRESTVGSIEADITTGSKTVEFVFGAVDNVYWLSGYSYNKRRKGKDNDKNNF